MAQEIKIKFAFSFAELLAQVLEKQAFLERDQDELTPRGVTPERMDGLGNLLTTFRDITPDAVYLARQTGATLARNEAQTAIGAKLREVAGVAANVLGDGTAAYRSFDYGKVADADAPEFALLAENMADRADEFQAQLTPRGIPASMITDIRSDLVAFDQLIKDARTAIANRDAATEARRIAANALYTDMADLADIAKIYWESRSEAKYNDYIIYHQSTTAQSRNGALKAATTKTRELHSMTADTSIIIKNEGEGTLQAYFSQHVDGGPAPEDGTAIFATIEPHKKVTVLAGTDLGFDPDIDAIHFTLRNVSADKSLIYRARIE